MAKKMAVFMLKYIIYHKIEMILWYNDIRKRKEKKYGKEICSNNVMY